MPHYQTAHKLINHSENKILYAIWSVGKRAETWSASIQSSTNYVLQECQSNVAQTPEGVLILS